MNITLEKFGYPETLVKEYDNWVVLLKPEQTTLGTFIIANKSEATYLGKLPLEDWAEFSSVSRDAELVLTNELGAEKFNYLALMMKDPNVHFHLVPRYSKPQSFNGRDYVDKDWPGKTELGKIDLNEESFDILLERLRGAIG